jgi:hypothetical protein
MMFRLVSLLRKGEHQQITSKSIGVISYIQIKIDTNHTIHHTAISNVSVLCLLADQTIKLLITRQFLLRIPSRPNKGSL